MVFGMGIGEMIFLAVVAAPWLASIDNCQAAVHHLATASKAEIAAACPVARDRDRLWKPGGEPEECLRAKEFAHYIASSTDLPPVMIAGMMADFDRQADLCRNPPKQSPMQVIHAPRLSD